MAQELTYTSAPRGLFPGSSGFCTVAMTDGLPRPAVEMLESLSNYYRPAPAGLAPAGGLPAVSYIRAKAGGQAVRVLSRNCEAPPDYTGRSNNLAHHLIPDADDAGRASNPAALAQHPGLFVTHWDGLVKMTSPRPLPAAGGPGPDARTWRTLAGDPGWALAVAETWIAGDGPLHLIFDPGTDLLPLLAEAIEQLPPGRRVDATFTTYFTGLPLGVGCLVRGVLAGSEQEGAARKARHLVLRDLRGRPAPVSARPPALVATVEPMAVPNGYGVVPSLDEPDEPYTPADAPPPPPGKKSASAPPPTSPRVVRNEYAEPVPAKLGRSKALLFGLLASVAVNAALAGLFLMSTGQKVDVASAQQAEREAKERREAAEKERDDAKAKAEQADAKAVEMAEAKRNAEKDRARAAESLKEANKQLEGVGEQLRQTREERDAANARAAKAEEAGRNKPAEAPKKANGKKPEAAAAKPGADLKHGLMTFEAGAFRFEYDKAELRPEKRNDGFAFFLIVPVAIEPKDDIDLNKSPLLYRLDARGAHPADMPERTGFAFQKQKDGWAIKVTLAKRDYLGNFPDEKEKPKPEDIKKATPKAVDDTKALFDKMVFYRKPTPAEQQAKAASAPVFYFYTH